MNKTQLINAMHVKNPNMTKQQITDALNSFLDVVRETTTSGEEVVLVGFGSFDIKTRKARTGRNPKTGEDVNIPETKVVTCKLSNTWAKLSN